LSSRDATPFGVSRGRRAGALISTFVVYSVPYFENSLSHLVALFAALIRAPLNPSIASSFPPIPTPRLGCRRFLSSSRRASSSRSRISRLPCLVITKSRQASNSPSSVPIGVSSSPFADNDHIQDIQEREAPLLFEAR
jgi:hypothetical protein